MQRRLAARAPREARGWKAAWWLVSHPLLRPGAAMGDGGTDGGMGGRKGSDTGEGAEELGALLGEERPPARERGRCCRR